jgi:hypothetical protein
VVETESTKHRSEEKRVAHLSQAANGLSHALPSRPTRVDGSMDRHNKLSDSEVTETKSGPVCVKRFSTTKRSAEIAIRYCWMSGIPQRTAGSRTKS